MQYSFGIGNKVTCQKPLVKGNRIYTDGVETVGGLDVSFPLSFIFLYVYCLALWAHRGQKRCGIPCSWSYRLVVKCLVRVLGTEPGSLRGQ